jgi:hypothetical protein
MDIRQTVKSAICIFLFGTSWLMANALGDLAAGMNAGDWRELTTNGLSRDFLERVTDRSASRSILQYSNKAAWDPNTEKFLFLGSAHDNGFKFIIYEAATNSWREGPLPLSCYDYGFNNEHGCACHSYYFNDFDPITGRFYYWTTDRAVYAYKVAFNSWGPVTSLTATGKPHGGMAYFPDNKSFIVISGWQGNVKYDLTARKWINLSVQTSPISSFVLYNPVHKLVLWGGGNNSSVVYKIDQTGEITQMKNSPGSIRVCTSIITVDPISGKFLVYYAGGSFYEYDVTKDNYSTLSLPPADLRTSLTCGAGVVAAPVSNYGVVMFLCQNPAKVFLYKHTEGSLAEDARINIGKSDIAVYPNPFMSSIRVRVAHRHGRKPSFVKVYDIRGREVADLSQELKKQGSADWKPTGLSAGIYIVNAGLGNRQVRRMLFYRK